MHGINFVIDLPLETIFLAVQRKAKMHSAKWQQNWQ